MPALAVLISAARLPCLKGDEARYPIAPAAAPMPMPHRICVIAKGESRTDCVVGFLPESYAFCRRGFIEALSRVNVRFGSLADIRARIRYVCFTPESGRS